MSSIRTALRLLRPSVVRSASQLGGGRARACVSGVADWSRSTQLVHRPQVRVRPLCSVAGAQGGNGDPAANGGDVESATAMLRHMKEKFLAAAMSGQDPTPDPNTGYSVHGQLLGDQLLALVLHPRLHVLKQGSSVFLQMSPEHPAGVMVAFTSEDAAKEYINSDGVDDEERAAMGVEAVPGSVLAQQFVYVHNMVKDDDNGLEGVDLFIDPTNEQHCVSVPRHHSDALKDIVEGVIVHNMVDTMEHAAGLSERVFASQEFQDALKHVLNFEFVVFPTADTSTDAARERYLQAQLPFPLPGTDKSAEGTLVFTSLNMAAQWVHLHGQGLMRGVDKSQFRAESRKISGSKLLKLLISERVYPDGAHRVLGNSLLINPMALATDDATVPYGDLLSSQGVDSADAARSLTRMLLVSVPADEGTASKHWIAEALRRGLLTQKAKDE